MKRIIALICLIVIGGCSYARIKNTVGGPNGLTYSKTETTAPIKSNSIVFKKVNGRIVRMDKSEIPNSCPVIKGTIK